MVVVLVELRIEEGYLFHRCERRMIYKKKTSSKDMLREVSRS